MKLNFKRFGDGEPLLILHGLMGMLDNWQGPAKAYSEHFDTIIVDARNHGHSEHSPEFNYQAMMDDVAELCDDLFLDQVNILGHSMGGKTAMKFAQHYPEMIDKLIIADIAPKAYSVHHQQILAGLNSLDFSKLKSRGEVDKSLKPYIPEVGVRQFLMKSIYWREKGKLGLRFNLSAIAENIELIGEATLDAQYAGETLFIRGANSNYISNQDFEDIKVAFPNATLETIMDAGHWLHAEKPEEFLEKTLEFLKP